LAIFYSTVYFYQADVYIRQITICIVILENLNLAAYVILGFAISYLALEGGWHFTACKIKDKAIPPCVFKQVKAMLIANNRSV
jgi:hypothetical protein